MPCVMPDTAQAMYQRIYEQAAQHEYRRQEAYFAHKRATLSSGWEYLAREEDAPSARKSKPNRLLILLEI